MTEVEFRALAAQGYNRVPLVLESFADLDTPLSLYLKLANRPYSFLLESVVGGERFGRYSFIGLPATTRLRTRGRDIEVDQDGVVSERHDGDPLDFIAAFQRRYRAAPVPGLPRFCGGLAGYFAYDVVRHIEDRLSASAPPAIEALADIPDVLLLLTEELAVVDNLQGKISLIVYADPALPDAYRAAHERLQALRRRLRAPVEIPFQTATQPAEARSEFGAGAFQAAVTRAREYIAAGDIMQVVLSQRMTMPFAASPSVGKMPNPLYPFDARLVSSWFCRSCFQSVGTSKLPLVSLKSVAASAMAERMGSKYGCGPPGTIATVAAVVPPPPPWLPPHEVSTKSARMDTASLLPVTTYLLVVKVYWKCQYPIVY